ncbi:MAG: nicotinate (nicotinamide) nucleotide adenylyltransferase [Chlorobium sp.]|uniref:nicotinate (nicotinamide) nucleotide adenylyltransferase n=1 Tax=Chlorobium sp. TaxID=1095 RepID=UPI0025B934AC|nr:nicotinate (nicotinamide) nucleotide adenylyltransferase [Chlorobium sp.]MCF8382180.1 nicotinate (nicotinamide) nucleotide adenylyltransferase [Chlorobium sp.]
MHLALYGGSFDPPHNGHLALCLFASELLRVDRLIISVSNNPFKGRYLAADVHRKGMAQLLAGELSRVGISAEVSGWELEKRQPSFTIDLIRYVRSVYPLDSLTLLIGEDSFREITSWKSWQTLFSLCRVAVFRRSSAQEPLPPEVFPPDSIRFIDFDCPISSTIVRQAVVAGLPVAGLLPSSIRHYIAEHGLYRTA